MMINRGYITAGEAGLIVFLAGMAVFVIALWLSAGKNADDHGGGNYADEQHIYREPNMCAIRVTAPCGDNDICRYKASVPCDELEALIRKERKHDTVRETN